MNQFSLQIYAIIQISQILSIKILKTRIFNKIKSFNYYPTTQLLYFLREVKNII